MNVNSPAPDPTENHLPLEADEPIQLSALVSVLLRHWRRVVLLPLVLGGVAYFASALLPPRYTAKASFLPPQQAQSSVSSALASLGSLAGLGSQAVRNPSEQYVSLMQSASVIDPIIDRFDLIKVYESPYRIDAQNEVRGRVRFNIGKKDGLIYLEADDRDPQRAADIANAHIEELQRITSRLAVTEAQQRREFFETQLKQTRDNLTKAQVALQDSGFSPGALKAEPKTAAEGYARLKSEVTNAEVRLQTMRGYLNENAPDYKQAKMTLDALRQQLARSESASSGSQGSNYVGKYREFKYQETLFDMFARQYEIARVDESREGTLIQVLDPATPPEKRSGPRKARIAAAVALALGVLLGLQVLIGHVVGRRRAANAG